MGRVNGMRGWSCGVTIAFAFTTLLAFWLTSCGGGGDDRAAVCETCLFLDPDPEDLQMSLDAQSGCLEDCGDDMACAKDCRFCAPGLFCSGFFQGTCIVNVPAESAQLQGFARIPTCCEGTVQVECPGGEF